MKMTIKQLISVTVFAAVFSACKKEVLDINVDPNNPTTASATPGLVLPSALRASAVTYNAPTFGNNQFAFAGIWLGHMSYSGNYAISTENLSYQLTNNFAAGLWGNVYDNNNDFNFVETKGKAAGNAFYEGIGKLMKAYNYQTLVDCYNNIPYSQALKGTANSKPAFDNGKDVYTALGKQIDSAIALFNASIPGSITGDIMFSGDPTKWAKFANTVKLRLLLRQSEIADRQSYITAEVAKLGSGFVTTDVLINPGYLNSDGKQNPFWSSNINTAGTYTQDFFRGGQYFIQFMKDHNDTRIGKYFKTVSGNYQGNYFGEQGLTNSKTSEYGTGILKAFSQPSVLMTAAESYFLQAEAVLKGWIAGDAKALYQSGVSASFAYLGATGASTYYSQANDKEVNWDATTTNQEKLALIIRQKWAAVAMINELEAFNDYRRLKLPADVPLSKSTLSTGIFPQRLLYPQREYEVNAENVLAQGSNILPGDKVWWIK